MRHSLPVFVFLGAIAAVGPLCRAQDDTPQIQTVHVSASVSTEPLLAAAAEKLKQEKGLVLAVSTNITSSEDLDDLAQGRADMAFITRPISGLDRAKTPELELVGVPVGMQVVALGVSNDIWDAGVHSITQASMRGIYEQQITNWKDIGGPDVKITLFSFAQKGGVWEIFAQWLYGDNRHAPLPQVDAAASNQEARDNLEFSAGSIGPIGAGLVDGSRCHALGVDISGKVIAPTPEQVASGAYPLVRPMTAVSIGRPVNAVRVVTEFLTGPEGQKLVEKSGAFGLEAVPKPPADDTVY